MNVTNRCLLRRMHWRDTFLGGLMVVCIVVFLLSMAMREARVAIVKAKGLGMFSDFATVRLALLESFALNGVWPVRQAFNFSIDQKSTLEGQAVQGVINLERQDRHAVDAENKILSMRPATGPSNVTVLWVCGNATVPQGMQVSGVNRTSLKQTELYAACR